ncbi:MAG: beta-N-acetylhexosaminidase [Cyclobacteriaceae bacterium]
MKKSASFITVLVIPVLLLFLAPLSRATELSQLGLHVIPYPQEVEISGEPFAFSKRVIIVIDRNASIEDRFAAEQLVRGLKDEYGIEASISTQASKGSITLTRKGAEKRVGEQGYHVSVSTDGLVVKAQGSVGLFYGTQTVLQLFKKQGDGFLIPGLKITDWPDIKERAVHYDTKHHQDKKEYVESFIRDMARYKINMLVWEWEDKLAYTSHPEIGAPGAFTIEQMQEFTRYARQYHIELVPLVQGLGHVSFILKWPQHAHLREIASSNWEFCPLKEESYKLLFDLWGDAIKATPGSRYIHIGSDETYELAMCDACKAKAAGIGKSGVYTHFINTSAKYLKTLGREVMAWETPMGWVKSSSPAVGITPQAGLVLTESYHFEEGNFRYARQAKSLGYKVFSYDPNPGIEHIFLPYFYKERGGKVVGGSLQESYEFLTSTTQSGAFDGMISTSWDDSGLHNQAWMLRFATAAAFSWNGKEPKLEEFRDSFFKNYYGLEANHMDELFQLFNEGAFYYMLTFERRVWHHGVIGKTYLPDLPRGDAIEYDPYWNEEYSEMVKLSEEMAKKMERAMKIIELNQSSPVRNPYDFEVFHSMAKLIWHTTQTYNDLSQVETFITQAHRAHFESHQVSYDNMEKAAALVESSLKRRETIFNELVATWEKVRLPKGLSTKDKKYFFRQDRARHFANRVPDMSYLIYDEQKLDMEGYVKNLREYMEYYKKSYLD